MKPVLKNSEAIACKRCYLCVRVCPSKAIRVQNGKALIDLKRCIHCGNCIRVCPAGSWEYQRGQALVRGMLNSETPAAVVLDTAFPAAFPETDHRDLVARLRRMGFRRVLDASFGADIVAALQKRALPDPHADIQISAWCPACVDMIRKFDPVHLPKLSGTLPPMAAMARVVRDLYGPDIHIVYVSPCIAHKALANDNAYDTGVDAVLTFEELAEMLEGMDADAPDKPQEPLETSDFDPPHGNLGITSGLLLGVPITAGYPCNPMDTIVTDGSGPRRVIRILDSILAGEIDHGFIDLMFCRGCIDGCALPRKEDSRYKRRNAVLRYADERRKTFDETGWSSMMQRFGDIDLRMTVTPLPLKIETPSEDVLESIRTAMDEFGAHQKLNCYACGYATCGEFVAAVGKGLAELDMCIQYQLRKLQATIRDLRSSHQRMNNILDVLHHSEKLANLAQLSAATAFKLNNPLSVVLLYSHLLNEEYRDNPALAEDLRIIVDQVEQVKDIFITLLNLSSRNKILLESVDVRELIDRTLMMLQPPDKVTVNVTCDIETAVAVMDREQIGYVLTNLVENALEAMNNHGELSIHTTGDDASMVIRISDTGPGIRKNVIKKIWDPFFTTKRVSVGAGLGLAVVREIIRQHQGTIDVVSNDNASRGPTGTTFTITIPRHGMDGMPGGF